MTATITNPAPLALPLRAGAALRALLVTLVAVFEDAQRLRFETLDRLRRPAG